MKKMMLFLCFTILFFVSSSSVYADSITIEMDETGYPVNSSGDGWYTLSNEIVLTETKEYYFNGEVNIDVRLAGAILKGGTFNGSINSIYSSALNSNPSEIAGGTFNGTVYSYGDNGSDAKITGGIFNNYVNNSGIITGGVFNDYVSNSNIISGGIFYDNVRSTSEITGGIFYKQIENNNSNVYKLNLKNAKINGFDSDILYVPAGYQVELISTINEDFIWDFSVDTNSTNSTNKTIFMMPYSDLYVEAKAYSSSLIRSIEKTDTNDNVDTYTITFMDNSTYKFQITNGVNGTDGENGIDGITPKLSINSITKELEVSYDNGETWSSLGVVVEGQDGIDGKNGVNGKDGITPKFQINNNELEVSYDNGKTWLSLGKVVGKDGQNGINGINGINGENGIDGTMIYGIKEYIIIGILGIMALFGNIGWIVALKKQKN